MKKSSTLALLMLIGLCTYAQNPEIKSDLPNIISPSPTVSAMMKFDEIPVSNYTGVPDISIPLFTTQTHSKEIQLNIALKYHSGVGANDIAGDVGLGWSLYAGGSISRTVRGLPDEQFVLDGSNSVGKVGIYHTSISNHINYYYQYDENFLSFVTNDAYAANQYVWDVVERGKFDTEHDLWQFNFMGNSGRFYIEKNSSGVLEVKPLDDYRVRIINLYATVGSNNYVPIGFIVYDEKGYKYEFKAYDITQNLHIVHDGNPGNAPSAEKEFRSAFHLTKIFDNNDELLIEYDFATPIVYKEQSKNSSETYSQILSYGGLTGGELMADYNCFGEFPPPVSYSTSISTIKVKKIQTIKVKDFARIEFTYLLGVGDKPRINEMIVKAHPNDTLVDHTIKKYRFDNNYSDEYYARMKLTDLYEMDVDDNIKGKHSFFYRTNSTGGNSIGKDYWGFYSLVSPCASMVAGSFEPTPSFSTTDLLQKISYPTGGCAIFNFEANEYSFIQNEEVTNYEANPNNYHEVIYSSNYSQYTFNATNNLYEFLTSTKRRKVKISFDFEQTGEINFVLRRNTAGEAVTIANLTCGNSDQCCYEFILEPNEDYEIYRNALIDGSIPSVTFDFLFFEENGNEEMHKFLYGGGNRIKRIGYFDKDVSQSYYETGEPDAQPIKELNYNYTLPGDVQKSSGSLAFLKPVFHYDSAIKINTICSTAPLPIYLDAQIPFIVSTNFNNLSIIKTQGADVGYKYVTVFETGNGSTDFEYKSPIDELEDVLDAIIPPFLPPKNKDYKRGLLIRETIKNQQEDTLRDMRYAYSFVNYEAKYGSRRYKQRNCGFSGSFFTNYSNYYAYLTGSQDWIGIAVNGSNFKKINLCGYPAQYATRHELIQAYGWAKLDSKSTKNYFYTNGGSTPNILQTDETYTYNPLNKKISESTVTNSQGEVLTTKYFYHTGNSTYSQNRISEIEKIETYRGANLLSTSKINYANTFAGNTSYLPETIATAKASQPLENRVRYLKYDEFSNPLEVEQEGGTKVCYIWGYDKTQPVAKIENITYNSIPSNVIIAIQNASNVVNNDSTPTTLAANLQALQDELDALRDHTALASAMVTTYTYIPAVGVKTITDPKGDKTTYEYDEFNRLKEVRDNDNNILSANQYHYKTQN